METVVQQRDYSTFELGDNVFELAHGMVPEVATELGIRGIGSEPSSEAMQEMIGILGPRKELRRNPSAPINRDVAADFVARSGIMRAANRSLWTPASVPTAETVDAIVMQGGVANWMNRTANVIIDSGINAPVHILAGTREMTTIPEKANADVMNFVGIQKRYPTEQDYARRVVARKLLEANFDARVHAYDTQSGDALFVQLFEENPELVQPGKSIVVARVASAGIMNALQLRRAARAVNPGFDADPVHPQLFATTDAFPVAQTTEQVAMPSKFQSPVPALRQLIVTAKLLHEAEL